MNNIDPVRIFIGSGEASLLERKVLIYSLRKNSKRDLDIYVFNGTHNSIERNEGAPIQAPMSLRVKYKNVTEFSLYRFLIPEICGHSGRAIFLDSDMICLGDIGELFDSDLNGVDFLAKRNAYRERQSDLWGLSVMLIDCERARFDLEEYVDEIQLGKYIYSDMTNMSPQFRAEHPFSIGELDPRWNEFDSYDSNTKLIHYTNLYTQPWKYAYHVFGDLWFSYFSEAVKDGYITDRDIEISISRFNVRRSIRGGNSIVTRVPFAKGAVRLAKQLKRTIRGDAGSDARDLKGVITN